MQQQVALAAAIAMQLFAATLASAQTGVACPVTAAPAEQTGPGAAQDLWRHGSEAFGVFLPRDGRWRGMAAEKHYRNKVFWYREDYDGRREPRPRLTVHGRRLDGAAPPVALSNATNAYHADFGGWSMLTMVEFPEAGCWEVTGEYGRDTVTFVVRVDR